MIDAFVDKFKEIVSKACERYGKQEQVAAQDIQVLLSLNEEQDVKYTLLKGYAPLKEVTFLQILDVRIDFRGYSMFVPAFIKSQIEEFAQELSVPASDISVMCVCAEDKSVSLWLYNKSQAVRQVVIEEL